MSRRNPDAGLLRNCARLIAMEAEWRVMLQNTEGMPDRPAGYDELIDTVTDTPANTEAGNRAKLTVVVSFYAPDFDESAIVDPILWDAVMALAEAPGEGTAA